MNKEEKNLIMQLTLGKLDNDKFWELYGRKEDVSSYIINSLEEAYQSKDSDFLNHILLLAYSQDNFKFDNSNTLLICNLIVEDWHNEHEDLATILQNIKDPISIPFLEKAMYLNLEYLEYNDGESLIRKCAYAIADINTSESLNRIKNLSKEENLIIRNAAIEQLDRKGTNLLQ